MRIFFGFGNPQLFQPQFAQILAERIVEMLRRERHRVLVILTVARHRAKIAELRPGFALEAVKTGPGQRLSHLACPVGAEVDENNRIAVGNRRRRTNQGRLDEFIVFTARISRSQRRFRGCCREWRDALRQHVVHRFDALPALVAVHGEVAAGDAADTRARRLFQLLADALQIGFCAFRRRIAAVEESMHDDILQAVFVCQPQQCEQVLFMAVNAAVRQQAQQMQAFAAGLGLVYRCQQVRIAEEVAGFDVVIDARNILAHDPPGTDVQVADFRVAELVLRQADMLLGRINGCEWIFFYQRIPVGFVRMQNGIVISFGAVTKSIQNNQNYWLCGVHICL